MHQSAVGGRSRPSAHTHCRNDQRRHLGRIVRSVVRRIQGALPLEVRGAVRGRLALLSALLTFVVLTGLTRIEPTRDVVISFMLINAAIILLLVGIIVREVWQVVQARRRGRAAARLHVQIVGLFSVIAVLPAVLVAIVANVTIDRGFDRLFSGPTREVIQNSLTIARAYLLRARGTHSRRHPRNGQRYLARPATVRPGSRHVSRASDGKCRLAQPAGRDADRQGPQHSGDGADRDQPDLRRAAAGIPQQCQGNRTRDLGVSRRELRRGRDPAARLQRHLPLRRPSA